MRYVLIGISMMVFLVVSLAGFRGDMSRKPPLEVFPDMDRQPKLRPLEPNSFFENGMSSQPLVKGTVRRSEPILLANGEKVYPFQNNRDEQFLLGNCDLESHIRIVPPSDADDF